MDVFFLQLSIAVNAIMLLLWPRDKASVIQTKTVNVRYSGKQPKPLSELGLYSVNRVFYPLY